VDNDLNHTPEPQPHSVGELPLFPLDIVLFPNMILPLHIFEERYKEMINYCLHTREPFGVVLIKGVVEETGRVETFPVGCTARISGVERLADGRLNIEVIGEQRFRILDTHEQRPYRVGLTEAFFDNPTDREDIQPVVDEVQLLLHEFLVRSLALMNQEIGEIELPSDPQQLTFTAACVLPISNPEKQEILATINAEDRLYVVRDLLRAEIERLKKRMEVVWKKVQTTQYDAYRCPN